MTKVLREDEAEDISDEFEGDVEEAIEGDLEEGETDESTEETKE